VEISFAWQELGPERLIGSGTIEEGQIKAEITVQMPLDAPYGPYHANTAYVGPCGSARTSPSVGTPQAELAMTLVAPPNRNNPALGDPEIAMSLSRKQFLDAKIAEVDELRSAVSVRLAKGTADTVQLRDFLYGVTYKGIQELDEAESGFQKITETSPAFFADLRMQYQQVLLAVRSPQRKSKQRAEVFAGSLVQVRLSIPLPDASNTWPAVATRTWEVLKRTVLAYLHVRDTGRITFNAQLRSSPPGARIRYKKLVDPYFIDYSSPTDVSNAAFELATWDFEFHHVNCRDRPTLRIDPYEDARPNVYVIFHHCRKR
jgi:hypothetical protein